MERQVSKAPLKRRNSDSLVFILAFVCLWCLVLLCCTISGGKQHKEEQDLPVHLSATGFL